LGLGAFILFGRHEGFLFSVFSLLCLASQLYLTFLQIVLEEKFNIPSSSIIPLELNKRHFLSLTRPYLNFSKPNNNQNATSLLTDAEMKGSMAHFSTPFSLFDFCTFMI
jgi:hypothetical protein